MNIKKFASLVRRERGVLVKVGRTNGRECLHLTNKDWADRSRSSVTLYTEAEWDTHPWNSLYQKERRDVSSEVREVLANKSTT